jgi:hypothetical protein
MRHLGFWVRPPNNNFFFFSATLTLHAATTCSGLDRPLLSSTATQMGRHWFRKQSARKGRQSRWRGKAARSGLSFFDRRRPPTPTVCRWYWRDQTVEISWQWIRTVEGSAWVSNLDWDFRVRVWSYLPKLSRICEEAKFLYC